MQDSGGAAEPGQEVVRGAKRKATCRGKRRHVAGGGGRTVIGHRLEMQGACNGHREGFGWGATKNGQGNEWARRRTYGLWRDGEGLREEARMM